MTRRTERVNDLLREELSQLIQREIKDPRLGDSLISVTEVVVAPDLRHATVFISQLGGSSDHNEVLTALQHASRFLHNELMHRLALRHVPDLIFKYDISLERGARIAALINQVTDRDEAERQE
jgi:ribosome-binding factor A